MFLIPVRASAGVTLALYTVIIASGAPPLPEYITRKHWERKHGPAAYYGQSKQGREDIYHEYSRTRTNKNMLSYFLFQYLIERYFFNSLYFSPEIFFKKSCGEIM
jgi:hypothetical protein